MIKHQESIYGEKYINRKLSNEQSDELKNLYKFYHKKHWCYKKMYLYYKRVNLVTNIFSARLAVSGGLSTITKKPRHNSYPDNLWCTTKILYGNGKILRQNQIV